jgi:hypothetical protein
MAAHQYGSAYCAYPALWFYQWSNKKKEDTRHNLI